MFTRFEVMAVKIQIVFRAVMPCSLGVAYPESEGNKVL